MQTVESYLAKQNTGKNVRRGLYRALPILSLLVVLGVFWGLKLTGITIAGEAFCGKQEHVHAESCYAPETDQCICGLEEHIHKADCYSDLSADLETDTDWKQLTANLPQTYDAAKQIVVLARSQLGYQESTRNFQVDTAGVRRGITRYGQWYGNPYGDWSAMFVGFCLHYSGMDTLPMNAGPEAMRLAWEAANVYDAAALYKPSEGDLLFLDKDANGQADAVAIIVSVSDSQISVIEGDLQNAVAETAYAVTDSGIMGYGRIPAMELKFQSTEGATRVAQIEADAQTLFEDKNLLVIYLTDESGSYALNGSGAYIPVEIGEDGSMYAQTDSPQQLFWVVEDTADGHRIFNLVTRMYLPENGITPIATYALGDDTDTTATGNYEYARAVSYSIWLDGTMGGLGAFGGSPNTHYTAAEGTLFQLPETWQSPTKYSYKLQGWYDVTNSTYYRPGDQVQVTGNMVFYADWVASTYDIGVFNAQVSDTVSTNEFITTHLFDYNSLFNILSANANVTVSTSGHSEAWSMVTSGNVGYGNQQTLNFVFIDGAPSYQNGNLAYPNNRPTHNTYPGAGIVTSGIYNEERAHALFDPTDSLGKKYLGTADHLFQIMTDSSDEYYGYYYYDSQRNAASYNQSQGRFFVYEYLEAPSDAIGSSYSGFLPLNSPYANTNANTIGSYTYNGINGEYAGVNHYQYASAYSSGGQVLTNFAYGMKSDIQFYLPDDSGTDGNKDIHGNDMHFHFSGDDDVWVLIDGVLVLDIGGIHGVESGDINFTTGEISVQGNVTGTMDISAGEHVMTVLYLERGASQSNCAIYFNLAPRYSLDIQKEDVLTQQLLDGAQFSVYTDAACTVPAELYTSEAAYRQGDASTNTFTVTNGVAHIWGLSPSKTYYIKETGPPTAEGYSLPNGTIQLTINKDGLATYHVEVVDDPSPGFTVHGVSIDEQSQRVYIVVTNAPDTVTDTTTVQVYKKWEDDADHSGDYITAYLTVTDSNGTVRRIREILLSDENGWQYTWTNLPKYDYDTLTEIQYGIEESYESGYYSTVRRITEISIETTTWAEAYSFANGETYLLKTASGCLATTSATATTLTWVDEQTAKTSSLALWTATVGSDGKVKLTNGAGQILTFNYSSRSSSRYFYATTGSATYQAFTPVDTGSGFRFYATRNRSNYYISTLNTSTGRFSTTTSSNSGISFVPMEKISQSDVKQLKDWAYQIVNTPLEASNETSLTVNKVWDPGFASLSATDYEQFQVTVKLLANGKETGRTVTLSLKNNWQDTFRGLPYADESGNVISYSVEERWENSDWVPTCGEIVTTDGDPPVYSTTITNVYRWGSGEILPATGSAARLIFVLCGGFIMLSSLVYGIGSRRKRERRMK